MLTAYVLDIRFMHGIFILSDDDESPVLDSEDSWTPANSVAESDSVDEEAAEKLQNKNRDGTYTIPQCFPTGPPWSLCAPWCIAKGSAGDDTYN